MIYRFNFLNNAYWNIHSDYNICYIRTIGTETAEAILQKYDYITKDPRWNQDIKLINDYEDLSRVSLRRDDIIRISDFHEKIINRLGRGNWYFITSHNLYYGIIRMYATYVNYFGRPKVLVYKKIEDIKERDVLLFGLKCRIDSRIQQKSN